MTAIVPRIPVSAVLRRKRHAISQGGTHEQACGSGGGGGSACAHARLARPEFGRGRMAPGLLGLGRRPQGRRLCRAALRLVRSAPLLAPALSRRLPLRLLSLLALPPRLVAIAETYRPFPRLDPRRLSAAPPRSTASAASV